MSRSAHPAGPRHADVLTEGHYAAPPSDLNALDPRVWSRTVTRDEEGVAIVGGIDVKRLAREFGTPAYIMDEADFRARCRAWRDAFGAPAPATGAPTPGAAPQPAPGPGGDDAGLSFDANAPYGDVFYAGKAFLSRAVVRWLHEEGLNLDVCSEGELATALAAGMPADRIALHGNNKSAREIERAVRAGVGRIVLDSFHEIVRVAGHRRAAGQAAAGAAPGHRRCGGTHPRVHRDRARGPEVRHRARRGTGRRGGTADAEARQPRTGRHPLAHRVADLRHLGVRGRRPPGGRAAARGARRARRRAAGDRPGRRAGHRLHPPGRPARAARRSPTALTEIVTRECAAAGLAVPRLSVEPGRAIVGPTAFTLYEVGTIKPLPGLRTYVSVDGGMSDNIRTALYDAEYSVSLVSRTSRRRADAVAGGGQALRVWRHRGARRLSCRPTWRRET